MVWAIVETMLAVSALLVTFVFGYILGHTAGWKDRSDAVREDLRERLFDDAIHARDARRRD